ncbi:MAG: hypothetical protein H6702_11490 [Myxococcales bacterium]|nr:hypothetical protein [Myxococcales bacterium]
MRAVPMRRWAQMAGLCLGVAACAPGGGAGEAPASTDAGPGPDLDPKTHDGEPPDDAVDLAVDPDGGTDPGPAPDAAPPDAGLPGDPPRCPEVQVGPVPAALRLDPFYTQHVDVRGLPLVAGPGVPEAAFRVAAYTLENLLVDQPCARMGLQAAHVRFGIMGPDDVTSDMPEYSDFYDVFPGTDWDARGRGFGATVVRPLTTGAVENLLQSRQDPWFGENIFLHEVAHSIFEFGVEAAADGQAQRDRLEGLYRAAMTEGRWANTYAATNANEYWAEGVQDHFDNNLSADPPNGVHNHVDTREELAEHDPALAAYIAEHLGTRRWPAYCDPDGAGPAWTPPPIPAADCPQRLSEAADQGCDAGALRSLASDARAEVIAVNQTLTPLSLHWIDFQGQRAQTYPLGPRQVLTIQSFATHGWAITDAQGTCHGGFVTGDGPTRFIVR